MVSTSLSHSLFDTLHAAFCSCQPTDAKFIGFFSAVILLDHSMAFDTNDL